MDIIDTLDNYINFQQPSLYYAMANIMFNPIFWNVAARVEYRSHALTKLAGNNALRACAAFAATIFSLGILRDYLYVQAIELQPILPLLESNVFKAIAVVLFLCGNVLVLSSMWALGVTGTYLGDYFGILKDSRVTGFPFNVCENPMYTGCTISFLGTALWYASPSGLLLTLVVHVVYRVALRFEGPFTAMIYATKDK
ncbi:hypothetical protein HA402_007057 [Bradysia odoriphaga]|nr:hypothetical protein HA402_007057 [Bradysia odoriphaga]